MIGLLDIEEVKQALSAKLYLNAKSNTNKVPGKLKLCKMENALTLLWEVSWRRRLSS